MCLISCNWTFSTFFFVLVYALSRFNTENVGFIIKPYIKRPMDSQTSRVMSVSRWLYFDKNMELLDFRDL